MIIKGILRVCYYCNFSRWILFFTTLAPCKKIEYQAQNNADYYGCGERKIEDEVIPFYVDISREFAKIRYFRAVCGEKADYNYDYADDYKRLSKPRHHYLAIIHIIGRLPGGVKQESCFLRSYGLPALFQTVSAVFSRDLPPK